MSNDTTHTITTTDPITETIDTTIDGYLACWNTTDPAERAELVARYWAPGARMSDPLLDVTGHEELTAVFTRFHETYPGCSFRRAGGNDGHHELVRWGWEMIDPDGALMLDGIDVAVVAPDGRLQRVAGFFGAAIPG